jgi:hypothetical protein
MKMKFTGFYLEFLRIFAICFKCRTQENPDGLQLPGFETPSDMAPTIRHKAFTIRHKASTIRHKASTIRHKAFTIRPKASTIRHKASTIRPKAPPSDTRPAPPVTRPSETRQLGTSSSQSSPAPRTPHITGDRESSPGHEGESEALDDLAEDVAESEAVSKKYFKGSSIIQGSNQKSHDMALLESVLTYMVDHQVINSKNNDIQFTNSYEEEVWDDKYDTSSQRYKSKTPIIIWEPANIRNFKTGQNKNKQVGILFRFLFVICILQIYIEL